MPGATVPCWVPGAGCWVWRGAPGAGCGAGAGCWVRRRMQARSGTRIATAGRVAVRRYSDLVAWQLAHELKLKVYALVDRTPAREDRRFCDQIKDAAASAPRNLAEGFGCYRHPEFARYTRIAKASLIETHQHLGDGTDRHHWPPREAVALQQLADRATGACVRLLHYLETTEAPGTRTRRR